MWFRIYTDVRDDPKVQRLPGETFKQWINLLCLAKEHGGLIPPLEDMAYKLKITEAEAQCLVEELVERKLLDSDGENLSPHNWHKRQFESDNSTERVKRFRNVSETLPDTETEQRQNQRQSRAEGVRGKPPHPPASRAKPRSARTPVLPDDEFLDGLQKNPAYSMLDVRHCYQRMLTWCQVNGRTPSRRRFINWLNKEDKPMTVKTSPPKKPTGNGQVGASPPPAPGAAALLTDAQMAEFIDELIEVDDFAGIGEQYELIVKRGGPKAEWEIRCVAYYGLHKDELATPEQVAELKSQITKLANKR